MSEEGYESGPFCWHWRDPCDCYEECLNPECRHECHMHHRDTASGCDEEGCRCEGIWWENCFTGEIHKGKGN